jgi:hypothetical protein
MLGDLMPKRSKLKVVAVLFLLAILFTGSASVFFSVSGIFVALIGLIVLCLLLLLGAVALFSKKKQVHSINRVESSSDIDYISEMDTFMLANSELAVYLIEHVSILSRKKLWKNLI